MLAGDSCPWLILARALGVSVEPASAHIRRGDDAQTGCDCRLRVGIACASDTAGARPCWSATTATGSALEVPYRQGNLVVIATPEPLDQRRAAPTTRPRASSTASSCHPR